MIEAHEVAHEEKARRDRDEEEHRGDERERRSEWKEKGDEMNRMIRRRLRGARKRTARQLKAIPQRPLAMRDGVAHRGVPRNEL